MGQGLADKNLTFVVENHKDIESLIELYERAQDKLPEQADRLVRRALMDLKRGYFADQGLSLALGGDEPRWFDVQQYDEEKEQGFYFDVTGEGDWDSLAASAPDEAYELCFAVNMGGIKKKADKKKYFNKVQQKLEASRSKLERAGITLPFQPDLDDVSAYYSLIDEVSVEALADPAKMKKQVSEAVVSFTKMILKALA